MHMLFVTICDRIDIDSFSRSMSIDFTQSARYQAHENHCRVSLHRSFYLLRDMPMSLLLTAGDTDIHIAWILTLRGDRDAGGTLYTSYLILGESGDLQPATRPTIT